MIKIALLLVSIAVAGPPPPEVGSQSALDELMRQVLERRDANGAALSRFTFHEVERMVVRGQEEIAPLQSYVKEFAWSGGEDALVRAPLGTDGVLLDEPGRAWDIHAPAADSGVIDAFYAWDSLFAFPYEPGRYFLAGREVFEGGDVLRIEYFPRAFFSSEDAGDSGGISKDFDRTSVVTLLVAAPERRIVAWRFDNIGLQFLPFRWLARIGSVRASMTLDVGADGTWLPREIRLEARASTASTQIAIELNRSFDGFRPARADAVGSSHPTSRATADDHEPESTVGASGRPGARVAEVAFHGNFSLPDGQLGGISGVVPGDPYTVDLPATVSRRLLASGVVDRADVRVRWRGLRPAGDVSLVSVVRERPGIGDHIQVLPLFEWSDEYGVTVGGRVSLVDLYGVDDRLSFPVAVGGRDRARVEFVDDFPDGFLSGLRADAGYSREANPHFDEQETRLSANGRIFRRFGRTQLDFETGWARVDFRERTEEQASLGITARYDTRRETGLPRNAVYLAGGWRPLWIIDGAYRNRLYLDARAYVGVMGRSALVLGTRLDGADGPLPDYEKYLLGGLNTLRGFAPGQFIGDNRLIASAEVRTPIWNPVPIVVVGVNGFWDTGTAWDDGLSLSKAKFRNGVGGGAFLLAGILRLNVDVGYGLGDGWQLHIGSGLRY